MYTATKLAISGALNPTHTPLAERSSTPLLSLPAPEGYSASRLAKTRLFFESLAERGFQKIICISLN